MTEKEQKCKEGKVWLVGAGPGDAGLLTVKAARLLKKADVIVYDALVSAELLSWLPDRTEKIYVGKHAGNHPVPQEEINQILIREAKAGKCVVRLKGGDPFVFGRGGEELEVLAEEGIPFEAVPGVTSSAAVPAYAGIPVTHRDYASSFHVITGHAKKDGTLSIDFPALVKLGGTLVFLMSVSSMEKILKGLMDAGMNPEIPAAVIERGTTARQRQICATVGTLKEKSDLAEIHTPAMIVVGEVCTLAGTLGWAQKRPLGGKQYILTRPRQNMSVLAERLRALGAQVIEMPAIRTEPVRPNKRLKEALERMETPGEKKDELWLVFTSPVGVTTFFDELREIKYDLRKLLSIERNIKVAAIGSATAGKLGEHGLFADLVPEVYSARELGEKLAAEASPGAHIMIVRAEEGSGELVPPLRKAQLEVEDIPLYRTLYDVHPALQEEVRELLKNGEIDGMTFTSASTVHGFVRAMGGEIPSGIRAVCIGEQTAKAAAEYGMETVVSDRADMDSMVEKILETAEEE